MINHEDNLAASQPEKVKEGKALWDAWNGQQAPPNAAKDKSRKQEKRKAGKPAATPEARTPKKAE